MGSDFNGDGIDDILWRHRYDNVYTNWLGTASGGFVDNGANAAVWVPHVWHVSGTGDFNGDGRDDILWRHHDGLLSEWLGTASGGFVDNGANAGTRAPTDWQVSGTGDFNGDGRDDILWRHNGGMLSEWLGTASGAFVDNGANAGTWAPTDWQVSGTGDFNGDGRDDILWRHNGGMLSEWLGTASGAFVDNGAKAGTWVPTDWQVSGTGDFNGDGRDDIIWRHSGGMLSEWLGTASGAFVDNGANAGTWAPTDWQVPGTGDFNGDGKHDILWRSRDAVTNWLGADNGVFVDNGAAAYAQVDLEWFIYPNTSGVGWWDY